VLGRVLAEFPDQVRLVYKDFPLDLHAGAEPAAMAARCAGERGRYWEYHDLLFVAQPAFTRADLITYAVRLGLPQEAFAACLDSARYRDAVRTDLQEGRAAGVSGTPTFFLGAIDGDSKMKVVRTLRGAQPYAAFKAAIDSVLSTQK